MAELCCCILMCDEHATTVRDGKGFCEAHADLAMEIAIDARDEAALTREILGRLDAATYGTGFSFRIDWGHPPSWSCTSKGPGNPEHPILASAAAKALIRDAEACSGSARNGHASGHGET